MTIEERLQRMLGVKDFQIADLTTKLEQANSKIDELTKLIPETKPQKEE